MKKKSIVQKLTDESSVNPSDAGEFDLGKIEKVILGASNANQRFKVFFQLNRPRRNPLSEESMIKTLILAFGILRRGL